MKQFNKVNLEIMRNEIEGALNQIAEKHGLDSLTIRGMTYSREGDRFTTKIEGKISTPESIERNKRQDEELLELFGLPKDTIDRKFNSNGQDFKVIRIDGRKPKFPIIATCFQDGKTYKFPADRVKMLLAQ